MINIDGYTFSYKKDSRQGSETKKKRWVCSSHFCLGCKAVIYTVEDTIVSVKNIHNHECRQYKKCY